MRILLLIISTIFIMKYSIVYAELTFDDMEKIRKIIKEELLHTEKRFDSIEKRFDSIERRFDSIERRITNIEKRMINIEKRVEKIEARIYYSEKRIDELNGRFNWGFGLLFSGMLILIGFVLWDRRTALAPAIRKNKELEEKTEKIEKVLKDYAVKDSDFASIMKSHGLF